MKSWGNQLPHMRILIQVHTAEYRWPCHWFTCLLQCESIEHWCLMCDPLNFRFLWDSLSISSFTSSILEWGCQPNPMGTHSCSLHHIWFNTNFVHHITKLRFYSWYLNKFLCDYCNRGIHSIWRMDLNFWGPLWEACSEHIQSWKLMFVP
jgi:hypothetical protein